MVIAEGVGVASPGLVVRRPRVGGHAGSLMVTGVSMACQTPVRSGEMLLSRACAHVRAMTSERCSRLALRRRHRHDHACAGGGGRPVWRLPRRAFAAATAPRTNGDVGQPRN
jgi:hypothetical protein